MDKKEWLETWNEIKTLTARLEKKQPMVLKGFEDILREDRVARQNRDLFLVKTKKRQHNIKLELAGIQKYIQDVCSATADPKNLQGMLEKFEGKLADYKFSMRNEYNSLVAEEEGFVADLEAISADVSMWEADIVDDGRSNHSVSAASGDASQSRVRARQAHMMEYHAKIGALDRKLATMGGRTGGWDPRDHDSFLKVLTVIQAHGGYTDAVVRSTVEKADTCGGDDELHVIGQGDGQSNHGHVSVNPQFVSKFVAHLPGKTVSEIEEHIVWHMEYMSIQSEKKMILSEWRDEKSKFGQGINRLEEADTAVGGENHSASGCSENRSAASAKFDEAHLAAKREKVEQWRRSKLEEQEAVKRKEEERRAAAKARADEERLTMRQQNRLKLEQWKEEADAKKRNRSDVSVPERPKSVDPASMRRRQARDLETAKERLEKKSAKQKSLSSRETRLRETEKLRVQWEGPSKLLNSTKAVNAQKVTPEELDEREYHRKHDGAHSTRIASGGYDLKYAGRAIPAWTRGANF